MLIPLIHLCLIRSQKNSYIYLSLMKLAFMKQRNEVSMRAVRTAGVWQTIGYCLMLQNMFVPWSLPRIWTWGRTECTITFAKETPICKIYSIGGMHFWWNQNGKGELEWVIILQLKAQFPLIQIGHQGMNPCTWGSPSCRLSKGCILPVHWLAPEVLTEWSMQVWILAYRTGASWAAPRQPSQWQPWQHLTQLSYSQQWSSQLSGRKTLQIMATVM